MNIRKAIKEDYENIYNLVKVAFETAEVSDGDEQDFVLDLRKGQNYLPELEFVAEEAGQLIGHIMMTKLTVQTENGEFTGVLVAPLCVALSYRNQGIGGDLMRYACKQAVEAGYTAAFLVGNPKYYGRFGYCRTADFGICNGTKIPDEFVLGCELIIDALKDINGTIHNIS